MFFKHFKLIESNTNSIQSIHSELLFFITILYTISIFAFHLGILSFILFAQHNWDVVLLGLNYHPKGYAQYCSCLRGIILVKWCDFWWFSFHYWINYFSAVSGVSSSLVSDGKASTSCSSYSLVSGTSCCSNKSGSVSTPDDIGSRLVSGSTNLMCGASVSRSFTPVISISPIVRLL